MPKIHRAYLLHLIFAPLAAVSNPIAADDKPSSGQEIVQAARSSIASGEYRKAAERLTPLVDDSKAAPEILTTLVLAHIEAGDYERAEPLVSRLRMLTSDADALIVMARWNFLNGRIEDSIGNIRNAIKERKKTGVDDLEVAPLHVRIADYLFESARYDDAGKEYTTAIRLIDSEHARLHQLDIPHDHARYYSPEAVFGLSRVNAAQGNDARSTRLRKLNFNRLNSPKLLAQEGYAALSEGKADEADRAFEKALKAAARRPPYVNVPIEIAVVRGEEPTKLLTMIESAESVARDYESLMFRAYALSATGKHEQGLKTIEDAMRLGTPDARLHFFRGLIHHAMGDKTQAAAQLNKAMILNPAFNPVLAARAKAILAELETAAR